MIQHNRQLRPLTTYLLTGMFQVSTFKLYCDRWSVGHFFLVSGPPSGAYDQIFIAVRHLWSSCCGVPCLTSGRFCNLLIQFAVTLGSKFCRTHDHILLSHLRLPQPGGPGPRSPRNKVGQLYPRSLSSLVVASYDSYDLKVF
jgi:hypothetical protein